MFILTVCPQCQRRVDEPSCSVADWLWGWIIHGWYWHVEPIQWTHKHCHLVFADKEKGMKKPTQGRRNRGGGRGGTGSPRISQIKLRAAFTKCSIKPRSYSTGPPDFCTFHRPCNGDDCQKVEHIIYNDKHIWRFFPPFFLTKKIKKYDWLILFRWHKKLDAKFK